MTQKRDSARKSLKGGLVISIIFTNLYPLIFGIILMAIIITYGITTGVFQAIMSGVTGADAVSELDLSFLKPYEVVMRIVCIYAFISFLISIATIIMINNVRGVKALKVCGVLAIVASIPFIFIPLELIGGIKALTLKEEDADLNNGEPSSPSFDRLSSDEPVRPIETSNGIEPMDDLRKE